MKDLANKLIEGSVAENVKDRNVYDMYVRPWQSWSEVNKWNILGDQKKTK